MKYKDVTKDVLLGDNNDGECLPIVECVCGQGFDNWDFIISIYSDNPDECPNCKRKLFFSNSIKVYEVINEKD
jgi:hypothetical protein